MKKIIALIGCFALSGCAGNYMDKITHEEINKYCPDYEAGSMLSKQSCNISIEANLDELNAARKVKRQQLEKQQLQQEEDERQKLVVRLNETASKFNRSYEGELSQAVSYAYYGGEFNDGLYHIDMNVKISYCQKSVCYGVIPGLQVPVSFYNFDNPIVGSYLGGGYHRASVFNGKINITKVNI
ncbi:hypothetical protein VPHD81_0019 [Vibrio phage D81]